MSKEIIFGLTLGLIGIAIMDTLGITEAKPIIRELIEQWKNTTG